MQSANFACAIFGGNRFLCAQKVAAETVAARQNRSLLEIWLRGRDLNPRPSGYEPDELPGCSTPHFENNFDIDVMQIEKAFVRWKREVK